MFDESVEEEINETVSRFVEVFEDDDMKRPGFDGGSRVMDGEWSHGPTQEQGTPVLD